VIGGHYYLCNGFTLIVVGDEVGNTMCEEKHVQAASWSDTYFFSLALPFMLLPMTVLTEGVQPFSLYVLVSSYCAKYSCG
jgi:hypothetical protein